MKTVILADGHPTTRRGSRDVLNSADDIEVIAETGDGDETIRLAEEMRPDLVMLSLNLTSNADGILICQKLKALSHPPRVLVFSAYNFNDDIASCLLAGADSYMHKRCACKDVLEAVRATAEGRRVWDAGGRVGDPRSRLKANSKGVKLTEMEMEVVVLMIRRMSNEKIAQRLSVGVCTAKTHKRHIFQKLGIKNQFDLY